MTWLGVLVICLGGACCFAAQAAPEPPADESGSEWFIRMQAELRQELEPRYRYAEWPGKEAAPLALGRVSLAGLSVGDCSLSIEKLLGITVETRPNDGALSGRASLRLRFVTPERLQTELAPLLMNIREFESADKAQSALMDSFSSPLRSMPRSEGDGPAYGERRIDGIGDVCFKTAGGIECIVANAWFNLRFHDGPEPPCAIEDIAAAIVERLRATDAQLKAAAESPGRVVLKPVLNARGNTPLEIAAQPATAIEVAPGQAAMLVVEREAPPEAPLQRHKIETYATRQGSVLRALETDGRTLGPYTVTFTEADKGMQEVMGVVVLEDNSIQFLRTTIEVR